MKTALKLILLNLGIASVNILLFTVCGFSFASESTIIIALSITVVIMSVLVFFLANYKIITDALNPQEPGFDFVVEDTPSENYRETLLRYKKINPSLNKEIDDAIGQMDSIDRKQLKLSEVMKRNQIPLENLVDTGEDSERVILNNIRYVVNCITIWDDQEFHNPKKRHIYEENLKNIRSVLDRNDEILSEFDMFLAEVSKIKQEIIPKDSNLQSTISILKQLYTSSMNQTGGSADEQKNANE